MQDEVIHNTFIFNPGECAGFIKGKNAIGIINVSLPGMDIINFNLLSSILITKSKKNNNQKKCTERSY